MIIGVLSDTHLRDNESTYRFLKDLKDTYFSDADAILHAGDIVDPGILDAFLPAPVYGVRGNMDPTVSGFPHKRVVELSDFRIGLIHGWGSSTELERRVLLEFSYERLDCLVYGHSHRPANHRVNEVLLFNPGSATDPRQAPYPTVGLLHLGRTVRGEILRCG